MTLKEKFEQYVKKEVWEKKNYNAEECEQIADDFAIGFAVWCANNEPDDNKFKHIKYLELSDEEITKELLQIYKKEKGL